MAAEHPRRRSLLRRPRVLVAAVASGMALGFGIDVLGHGGWDGWLAARAPAAGIEVPPYDPRGRLVEVDGRGIYLDCRGPGSAESPGSPAVPGALPGSPTVILEAGFASGAAGWGHVLDGVAEFARVCAWDRPGLGRSEPRGRHSPAEALDDLWRALDQHGEQGPYVVAGHSFGGVYARILAGRRPDEVVALLMIDAYYPDVGIEADASLPADFRAAFGQSLRDTADMLAAGEDLDWARTMAELREAGPFEGPAILLSMEPRLRPFYADPDENAIIQATFEASLRRMFPNSRLEPVPGSGHLIQLDRPEVVIARIRELVELVTSTTAAAPQRRR